MIDRQAIHLLDPILSEETERKGAKIRIVTPYYHGHSHRFKKVVDDEKHQLVFYYPDKLSSLPSRVNSVKKVNTDCEKKGHRKHVRCARNVVYKIPLSCGKFY